MDSASLILRWFVPCWLLGWLMLPAMRRVLGAAPDGGLPDGGLAAGRVLFGVLVGLVAYWGAAFHLLPLTLAPFWMGAAALLPLLLLLREKSARAEYKQWLATRRGALLCSDGVFALGFAFFLWVRLRHPELNDLEKLMDSALMGALARTTWLPMENPWFSGSPLTSYYHFGPLLGALPMRALGTPVPLAYNLVQPLCAALFLSTLWAVGAALCQSKWRGVVVVIAVALLGHFEPIRQWQNPLPGSENYLARVDWWSTSRVFPDTEGRLPSPRDYARAWSTLPKAPWTTNTDYPWFAISEYPAFSLFTGDAHAHVFALPLAALLFALCWALCGARGRKRTLLLALLGVLLGAFVMTNTWDVPLYALLVVLCAFCSGRSLLEVGRATLFVMLAPLAALPYLLRFKPQVSGAVLELWPPAPLPFLLFWGGWLALWLGVLYLDGTWKASRLVPLAVRGLWLLAALMFFVPFTPVLVLAVLAITVFYWQHEWREGESHRLFALALALCGLIAVAAPQLFYMRGFFGDGGLRHQDTVFKFGLQGWLLLGVAAAALALRRLPKRSAPLLAGALLVPFLCAAGVLWTRTVRDAARDEAGNFTLSLDGARWLPPNDREALRWLQENAQAGDVVLEAVGQNEEGRMGGDFTGIARVSALTGLTAPLGWPQHVWMWGEDLESVSRRWETVRALYSWPEGAAAQDKSLILLRSLKVKWIFIGAEERRLYDAAALLRMESALTPAYAVGDTVILKVTD